MNCRNKLSVLALFAILSTCITKAGISDSIIVLDQVTAKAVKFGGTTAGAKLYSVDSLTLKLYQSGSLADLLRNQSMIALKSYGSGGLAVVSIRGGSSRQTAIIWNGFNIRSPMNGELNFSSLPAGFIDRIMIQTGGSTTMYGSGAACGVIYLSNHLSMKNRGWHGSLNNEIGSFGSFGTLASASFSTQNVSTRIKIAYQHADNDFIFKNEDKTGSPNEILKHAAYQRKALMHQASVRIKPHVLLETDLWYTGYYKQVPSTTFDYGASNASQKDEDFRLAANLSCETDQWILKFRSGFLQNSIQYNDSAESVIATDNNSLSFINEIEGKWIKDPKNTLCIGVNQTLENASSQSYLQIVSRNRYAVYGRYNKRLFRNRLNMSFETRQELVEDKLIPFVFSLGCDAHVYRGVNIKGIVAKHYAMPIYDDLFWKEDAFARGNPLLDPEYGWNFEMGTEHKTSVGKMNFTNELTVFYQHTIDQIIWMPEPLSDGTTGKWMPQNVDECKSGGMELTGRMISNLGNSGIDFRYQYTFTNSIILDNISGTVNRNPRIYIPRHNASLSLGYSLSRISLMYTQSFTGKCYYDNYHTMKAFTTGDMQVDYNLECRILCVDAYVRVRNLYNATYQIIKGYAQPPRNYSVGINLTF